VRPRLCLFVIPVALAVACRGEVRPHVAARDGASATAVVGDGGDSDAGGGRGRYEGRPIAQACNYLGAAWLDRPEREESERPEDLLDALAIRPGMVVADVGAGTGYFTLRLARRVGKDGKVIATDVQPEMITTLRQRVAEAKLDNVDAHVVTDSSAGLPKGSVDLVLLVDVYHELGDPAGTMKQVRAALTPSGRLVLVEYRGEDPKVPIRPEHKMTLAQVRRELEPMGFRFVESMEFLPVQRAIVFVRDDAPVDPTPADAGPGASPGVEARPDAAPAR
jgi:SAM-dependent methyltransferase